MAKSKRHALEMASAVGEGSAKLDFGHTSEKKQRMFDMIKKEKEIRKSREEKREKTAFHFHSSLVSSRMVTGPLLTDSTSISAPNSPVSTRNPLSRQSATTRS